MKQSLHLFFACALVVFYSKASCQMVQSNGDTLYGHEWINENQEYYAFKLAENGIYKIDYATLVSAGIPVESIEHNTFQLYRLGEEQNLYTNANGSVLEPGDFLEFQGTKMKGDLHEYLYENAQLDALNNEYNLITDTATYYLTWSETLGKRYAIKRTLGDSNKDTLSAIRSSIGLDGLPKLNKSFDFEPGAFPSHFRKGDGFFIGATRNYRIKKFELENWDETSELDGELVFKIENRNSEALLGVIWNSDTIFTQRLNPKERLEISISIPFDQLEQTNDLIFRNIESTAKFNLVHYRVYYPHLLNDKRIDYRILSEDLSNHNLLFSDASADFRVYFLDDTLLIPNQVINNQCVLNMGDISDSDRMSVFYNGESANKIARLFKVEHRDLSIQDKDYLIISTRGIFDENSPELRDYINYRQSEIGGYYKVKLLFYEDILQQFGFGIPRNFLALKNFFNFLDRGGQLPEKVFIIGKGRTFNDWRSEEQINNSIFLEAFIPSYGFHGSDFLLNSREKTLNPMVQMGRLPVTQPEQLRVYLNKIMQFDSIRYFDNLSVEDTEWQKQVLHLGGGSSEQAIIRSYLSNLEEKVENSVWDGEVTSFYKTSADPIQVAQSEALKKRINDGVSMITFFGHSSTGSFDFKLEDPSEYKSNGRYPIMYSMGCISGDIYSVIFGLAEQFVLEPEGGAIAYMASSGNAYLSSLNLMAIQHYDHLMALEDQSIGEIHLDAIDSLGSVNGTGMKELREQFILVGDPALKIGPIQGKDYSISYSSFNTAQDVIVFEEEYFEVGFDLHSLHAFTEESVVLEYEIEQNGLWKHLAYDTIQMNKSKVHIQRVFDIPDGLEEGVGYFHVTVDPFNEIDETPAPKAESNNRLGFNHSNEGYKLIFARAQSRFLYPEDYAIVTQVRPAFYAQSDRFFSGVKDYQFEIDTLASFDSPFLYRSRIESKGGAVEWMPKIAWEEDRVYYIRVSLDATSGDNLYWDERSFVYRPNAGKGWSQSHHGQFEHLVLDNVNLNSDKRFEFGSLINEYNIRNLFLVDNNSSPPEITLNNSRVVASFNPRGLLFVVIEDDFYQPVANDGEYGSSGRSYFLWNNPDTADRNLVMQFMEERVEEGDYVIFMPIRKAADSVNYRIEEWAEDSLYYGQNLFQLLEGEGASMIRTLEQNPRPYIFVYRKGVGAVMEIIGDDFYDDIRRTISFPVLQNFGTIGTKPIGQSKEFDRVELGFTQRDSADIIRLKLSGIDPLTNDTTLLEVENISDQFSYTFVSDTVKYLPEIKAQIEFLDTTSNDIPQLSYVRANFIGYPEFYYHHEDSIHWARRLKAGTDQELNFWVGNYSNYASDSLEVKYLIRDAANNETEFLIHYPPLDSLEIKEISFTFPTDDLEGDYELEIELNPENQQQELYAANNFLTIPFEIIIDDTDPFLEVLFDKRILPYGALVSNRPAIDIRFWDYDAEFSSLLDSSNIAVMLRLPDSSDYRSIYHDSGELEINYPADLNGLELNYRPLLKEEGIYSLLVIAESPSGKLYTYEVEFNYQTDRTLDVPFFAPNPSRGLANLNFNYSGSILPNQIELKLWNSLGIPIMEMNLMDYFQIELGENHLLLNFRAPYLLGGSFSSGVYPYEMTYFLKGGDQLSFTGKLIFTE